MNGLEEILNNLEMSGVLVGLMIILIIYFIIWLIALAFKIVSRWIYFKKCGEEGWKSLIPIYTDITLIKTSGLKWWWVLILYLSILLASSNSIVEIISEVSSDMYIAGILLFVLSILSIFSSIIIIFIKFNISYNISKKFNKDIGFAFLITFFEPIMLLILGLSKNYQYNNDIEVSENGIFGIKKSNAMKLNIVKNVEHK